MGLLIEQRIELVSHYYEQKKNVSAALHAYREIHNIKQTCGPCSKKALAILVHKFEKTGSVLDEPRSGRTRTKETTIGVVGKTLSIVSGQTPHGESSLRQVSRLAGVPLTTVHRITRKALGFHPYRIRRVQYLKTSDFALRSSFAAKCMTNIDSNDDWLKRILWTDEAHFHLQGGVNTHNCIIWSKNCPHEKYPKKLHDEYVTVWCGFTSEFLIGPYFFEESTMRGSKRVTVTSARYQEMITKFVIPTLVDRGVLRSTTFQQDGAPAHITVPVLNALREAFGNNIISLHSEFEWPPRSPDLSPADFWLWGYLKSRVYLKAPTTLEDLKEAIKFEILSIKSDQLCSAVAAFPIRIGAVLQAKGGHFET
jgi:hypothetical protein